ncbi:MAG: hypothetical protein ACW97P_00325 [Candidatus Hodarchaeales archaeon]|jgi:tRNA nucleotidyltransferase/poly(A) polymerase
MNDFHHQVENFKRLISPELNLVIKTLHKNGKDVYIIGGAVRDFLFGHEVKDFDLATDALPIEIVQLLHDVNIKTKPIGGKYGTVLAISNKMAFDISTFRKEEFFEYGKPPKVTFVTSLDEDLARRDFLINSIIYDPINEKFVDKLSGLNDFNSKTLHMIGDPFIRLKEDGLRVIRLARFMSKFDLKLGPELYSAVQSVGKFAKFRSPRVVQIELFKFLKLQRISIGLKLLYRESVLQAIFPKFPFLSSSDKPLVSDTILEKFSTIKVRNNLTRLFGILFILSNRTKLSLSDFELISQNLGLVNSQISHLKRLFHSLMSFPSDTKEITIRRWVRATGINTSLILVHIFFLIRQVDVPNSKNTVKKTYLDVVQNAVNKLKSGVHSQ